MTPAQIGILIIAVSVVAGLAMVLGVSFGLAKRQVLQREAHFRGYHEAMCHAANEAEQLAKLRLGENDHRGAVVARELRCLCEQYARQVRRKFFDTKPLHG